MEQEERCQEKVMGDWYSHQCQKKSVIEIKGKRYCGTHNPENVKKRDEKATKKWEKENRDFKYKISAVLYCKKKGLSLEDLEAFVKLNKEEKK